MSRDAHDATLEWLAALQARFSTVLRTPLADGSGTLVANLARYPREACSDVLPGPVLRADERLAVYNRQYWLRLLRTLHDELPLTTRLLGAWELNRLAMQLLHQSPPRGWDLGRVADGFAERLAQAEGLPAASPSKGRRAATPLPRDALIEAATIDDAYRSVFLAPPAPAFDPEAAMKAGTSTRLCFSPAYRRVDERWPLVELRRLLLQRSVERAVALPRRLTEPRHYALFRTPGGVGQVRLAPLQAHFLALLEQRPLVEALVEIEVAVEPARRALLLELTRRWLAQAVTLGFFGEPDGLRTGSRSAGLAAGLRRSATRGRRSGRRAAGP